MRDRNIEEYCSCIFMYLHVFTINRLITQINYLVHIILTPSLFRQFRYFRDKIFESKIFDWWCWFFNQISTDQWLDQSKILTIYKIRDNCIYQSSRFPSQINSWVKNFENFDRQIPETISKKRAVTQGIFRKLFPSKFHEYLPMKKIFFSQKQVMTQRLFQTLAFPDIGKSFRKFSWVMPRKFAYMG